MNKILKKLFRPAGLLILTSLMTGCTLHEEPELTAEGEMGVDPTEVTLKLNLTVNMSQKETPASRALVEGEAYMHRFIVETYLDANSSFRHVFYENVVPGRSYLTLPVQLKLHARRYHIAVWSDYVPADTREDLYYDTATLTPLINNGSYAGNSEYKDAFYATQEVDLTSYSNDWQAVVTQDWTLERPLGRYELIATDMEALRRKVEAGEVKAGKFTARIKYSDYLPVGFDVLTGELRNRLRYMSYKKTFEIPKEDTHYFTLAFDYLFCETASSDTPVEVEIVDCDGTTVARSIIRIPCTREKNVTIRSKFLTADPALAEDGIGIDPGFDDEIDMEVNVI